MQSSVIAIVYPGCIGYEIQWALELLHAKYDVIVAAPSLEPVPIGNGMRVLPDTTFADAPRENIAAVLIPGGDPGDMLAHESLRELLNETQRMGAWMGAVCAGPLLLADAGLLKDRDFTHGYGDMHRETLDRYWAGARYRDTHVVVDGKIVTAQPQGTLAFAIEIAKRLGVFTNDEEAAYRLRYGRGEVSMHESMTRKRA